jgi:serine/threonine protein kinase
MVNSQDYFVGHRKVFKGTWNKQPVAIKEINMKNIKKEEANFQPLMNTLRDLKHENIIQFQCLCSSKENVLIVATDYTQGRSLKRNIMDKTVEWDWEEKMTFCFDVARYKSSKI